MNHLAILKKELLKKILSGKKTVESRWYTCKRDPYENIKKGETVYLKEVGGIVNAKATVKGVLNYDKLDYNKIREILNTYGKEICGSESRAHKFAHKLIKENKKKKEKTYCTLVFLRDFKNWQSLLM